MWTNSRKRSLRIYLAVLWAFTAILWIPGMTCNAQESKTAGSASPFDSLKKTYAGINSLEASFHQKIFVSGIKKMRDFDGDFFFKRHKGFLWKYTRPKGKTFLYDGRYMWQEEEDKPFVIKNKVSREKTVGTFFDLIEDIAHIDNLFAVKQQSMIAGMHYFELVPKKDSSVNLAKLWIDKNNLLRKIEILEFTGNINTIEFSGIKVNTSVSDAKFVYKADGKKEVMER
ncbi:MAG: outer membrane lipoprotein carrier protein LolA [Syntrophorhabdaceae bacterium]|nr:outer membrane lipoprotein carrier protein LolA [Syntrophorhabdaceae bacterium]MDD4195451.1 outer membrane lipoprotein carrier protein LolA [Syntrophorhabdaceae bacterium]